MGGGDIIYNVQCSVIPHGPYLNKQTMKITYPSPHKYELGKQESYACA